MGSPFLMIAIFAAYLSFVFDAGPKLMKNRRPYKLTGAIRVYNIFQVGSCLCYLIRGNQIGITVKLLWQCHSATVVKNEKDLFDMSWYYLLLRLIELIETVFFVLRKKQNQISTLHVYHHISTAALYWMFFKYSAGEIQL